MAKAVALALLVLLGTVGFSAYAYTVYIPSLSTASPGTGSLNIYLADPPPANHSLKYLLVNVTSVTLKYSTNVTETTSSSTSTSASSSSGSTTTTSQVTTNETGLNRFVYNVSQGIGTNVNITQYQGSPLLLGTPQVPAGNVTGIILNISGARAFWADGNSTQLKVVANGKLMANAQFTILAGGKANIEISITPSSVHVSSGDVLRPVLMVTTMTTSSTSSSETSSSSTTTSSSSSQGST
jgi:hypothetical protein